MSSNTTEDHQVHQWSQRFVNNVKDIVPKRSVVLAQTGTGSVTIPTAAPHIKLAE